MTEDGTLFTWDIGDDSKGLGHSSGMPMCRRAYRTIQTTRILGWAGTVCMSQYQMTGPAGDRSVYNMAGGADGGVGRDSADTGGWYDESEGADLKIREVGVSVLCLFTITELHEQKWSRTQ